MEVDSLVPRSFLAFTHTVMYWTCLDRVILTNDASLPSLGTLCTSGPSVWFLGSGLTLKHKEFRWQCYHDHFKLRYVFFSFQISVKFSSFLQTHLSTEISLRYVSRPRSQVQTTTPLLLFLTSKWHEMFSGRSGGSEVQSNQRGSEECKITYLNIWLYHSNTLALAIICHQSLKIAVICYNRSFLYVFQNCTCCVC